MTLSTQTWELALKKELLLESFHEGTATYEGLISYLTCISSMGYIYYWLGGDLNMMELYFKVIIDMLIYKEFYSED